MVHILGEFQRRQSSRGRQDHGLRQNGTESDDADAAAARQTRTPLLGRFLDAAPPPGGEDPDERADGRGRRGSTPSPRPRSNFEAKRLSEPQLGSKVHKMCTGGLGLELRY